MSMKNHKTNLRPIVGAMIMALAAPAAMAAVTPPAANSLPGNFYNNSNVTAAYAAGNNSAATITLSGGSAAVLQWGGSNGGLTATTMATASNANPATNAGFDIGAGATLNIASTGTAPTAVLINDITGNPSQVYGTVNASSAGAPIFIANANGIIVGSGGSIVAPGGLALDGYAQDPGTFTSAAGIKIASGAVGTGDVTIAPGAKLNAGAGFLLVAGNANVNIGSTLVTAAAASTAIAAGYAVSATTGALQALTTGSASVLNSAATVNFNNVGGTVAVASLGAAGNVNVLGGANVSLASAAQNYIGNNFVNGGTTVLTDNLTAGGSFTNNGVINDATSPVTISAGGSSGSLVNNGVINLTSAGASTLNLNASTVGGTVTNNGVISFSGGASMGTLNVTGANVNLYGAVNQASVAGGTPTALTATNPLAAVSLAAGTSGGVLNLGTMLYASGGTNNFSGAAVRILSGGYSSPTGTLNVTLGSGKVGSYGYNLSLFPGATLSAPTVNIIGTDATNGSNLNLFGTITGSTANVSANTVNANSAGGFSVSQGGTLTLQVAGNVNNPNGAAAAGSTAFNYNYVPVTMQGTGGTLTVRPSAYTSQAQFVNVLVNGNATLGGTGYTPPLALGANIVPNASYPNSHLVVSATGNLSLGGFNWPGMLYLANVSSASNPTVLSSSGTITLTGAVTNVIPTNVGLGGGIWFMTNKALSGISSANYVETNTNSYVNFPLASGLAAAYGKVNSYFYGATPNANASNLLTTQLLPSSYIYGR